MTVKKMTEFIRAAHKNPVCRMMTVIVVRKYIKTGREFDMMAEVIYKWITESVKYFRDPHNVELVRDWENIVKTWEGDCDDFTVLSCSMLGSVGISTRIVICQAGKAQWNHVYAEYYSPAKGKWIPFDASMNKVVGWESPNIIKKRVFQV